MVVRCLLVDDIEDLESTYYLMGYSSSEGTLFFNYIPYIVFAAGYIMLVGNLLNNRIRRIQLVKWLVFLMMASQAYEIWSYVVLIVDRLMRSYFGDSVEPLKHLLLMMLSMVPGGVVYFNKKRRNETQMSWRVRGPRSELGSMRYYLTRPPPLPDLQRGRPHADLRRTRSQDVMATRRRGEEYRYPKSA